MPVYWSHWIVLYVETDDGHHDGGVVVGTSGFLVVGLIVVVVTPVAAAALFCYIFNINMNKETSYIFFKGFLVFFLKLEFRENR